MLYDPLIQGGRLFNPQGKKFERQDLAVSEGRVARIAPSLNRRSI